MLDGLRVLVVEDEWLIGTELALTIEDARGRPIGAVRSNREGFCLAASEALDAALLDVTLADGEVTPLAEHLVSCGVPIVLFTGGYAARALRNRHPRAIVLEKPAAGDEIVRAILASVEHAEQASLMDAL